MNKVKLNVGCGKDVQEGYINIDIRSDLSDVVEGDIRSLDKITKKGAVEEIRAIDVLEHVSYRETQEILKHWYQMLSPGGSIFIQSPHCSALYNLGLKSKTPEQKYEVIRRIFGGQEYPENSHYTCIDETLMKMWLTDIGYKNITCITNFGNRTNIRITAYK